MGEICNCINNFKKQTLWNTRFSKIRSNTSWTNLATGNNKWTGLSWRDPRWQPTRHKSFPRQATSPEEVYLEAQLWANATCKESLFMIYNDSIQSEWLLQIPGLINYFLGINWKWEHLIMPFPHTLVPPYSPISMLNMKFPSCLKMITFENKSLNDVAKPQNKLWMTTTKYLGDRYADKNVSPQHSGSRDREP